MSGTLHCIPTTVEHLIPSTLFHRYHQRTHSFNLGISVSDTRYCPPSSPRHHPNSRLRLCVIHTLQFSNQSTAPVAIAVHPLALVYTTRSQVIGHLALISCGAPIYSGLRSHTVQKKKPTPDNIHPSFRSVPPYPGGRPHSTPCFCRSRDACILRTACRTGYSASPWRETGTF